MGRVDITKRRAKHPIRPPSYVSIATLAIEFDVTESTIHVLVRNGVLPKPIKLSNGTVRWSWADVEAAMASMQGGKAPEENSDPFLEGARNATSAA